MTSILARVKLDRGVAVEKQSTLFNRRENYIVAKKRGKGWGREASRCN